MNEQRGFRRWRLAAVATMGVAVMVVGALVGVAACGGTKIIEPEPGCKNEVVKNGKTVCLDLVSGVRVG